MAKGYPHKDLKKKNLRKYSPLSTREHSLFYGYEGRDFRVPTTPRQVLHKKAAKIIVGYGVKSGPKTGSHFFSFFFTRQRYAYGYQYVASRLFRFLLCSFLCSTQKQKNGSCAWEGRAVSRLSGVRGCRASKRKRVCERRTALPPPSLECGWDETQRSQRGENKYVVWGLVCRRDLRGVRGVIFRTPLA